MNLSRFFLKIKLFNFIKVNKTQFKNYLLTNFEFTLIRSFKLFFNPNPNLYSNCKDPCQFFGAVEPFIIKRISYASEYEIGIVGIEGKSPFVLAYKII